VADPLPRPRLFHPAESASMALRLLDQQVFVPSPAPGVGVHAASYYTRASGLELLSLHSLISRSDTQDAAVARWSPDNGRTWGDPVVIATGERRPEGMWRRHVRGGYADPFNGRYFDVWTEGVLPSDNPLEGLKHWVLYYAISSDGGRSFGPATQIIQSGPEFSADHPLPGIWRGRNGVMLGDLTCRPVSRADGALLLPCQLTPLGPDGSYHNPGGGYTFHDSAILAGTWQPDGTLAWELTGVIKGDPVVSTRGFVEPTIEWLANDRLLMVMRGSNDARPALPGHRWIAISADGGRSFDQPRPWTWEDGSAFFSPSSCSQLLAHPNGRLYWLGNICAENPRGNSPRYPIVIAEVNRDTGALRRSTVTVIDDLRPGESPRLFLSNFMARVDRETGHIHLHLSRLLAHSHESKPDFTGDALLYRLAVDG